MKPLSIGQLAQRSGVNIETIRFYEREGLIPKADRSSSGYRQFDETTIDRLEFIQRAKELGFTLNEIKELLALWSDPGTSCNDVRSRAESKIADIDSKIEALQQMKSVLVRLTQKCETSSDAGCPILDELDGKVR